MVQVVKGIDEVAVRARWEFGARESGHGTSLPADDWRSGWPVLSGAVNRVRRRWTVVLSTSKPLAEGDTRQGNAMNTNLTTTRSITRTTALAACAFALIAGATACGTEHGTPSAPSGSRPQTLSSIDLIERAKANQLTYRQPLRAQRAPHGYGDDRRQPQSQPAHGRTTTTHHNPGFDEPLLSER